MEDLVNKKFSRLTVLKFDSRRGSKYYWECECECGQIKVIISEAFKSGNTKSCGCLKREKTIQINTKHGFNKKRNPHYLYTLWANIKTRCYNKNNEKFKIYGMRGIHIANQWVEDAESFINYILEYLGGRPTKKHSLDRINNAGNYESGNLRWSILEEQANNTRRNVYLEYNGENKTISQWARLFGIDRHTLRYRIKNGWPIEKALNELVNKGV